MTLLTRLHRATVMLRNIKDELTGQTGTAEGSAYLQLVEVLGKLSAVRNTLDDSTCDSPHSEDGYHRGYWIDKGASFRCYWCQYQYHLKDMRNPAGMKGRVEVWQGRK